MQHRREVRQASAIGCTVAAMRFAVLSLDPTESGVVRHYRRQAGVRTAFAAAEAALLYAMSMGEEQPALREFTDYEEDV